MSRRNQSPTAEEVEGFEAETIPASVERTPTVLLLDTSSSMSNASQTPDGERVPRIEQLNDGLRLFNSEVGDVTHAKERVDIAVVTFSSAATVEEGFTAITNWEPPTLAAQGGTAMGAAIQRAVELVEERKEQYRADGVPYNRPLIWLLTDGEPTDMTEGGPTWERVQELLENNQAFEFFAMGVSEDADMETLTALVAPTGRRALKIKEGMFAEYFEFLSNSLASAADPETGEQVTFDREQLAEITEEEFIREPAEGEDETDDSGIAESVESMESAEETEADPEAGAGDAESGDGDR